MTDPAAYTEADVAAAARAELERLAAEAALCRASLADFVQIAIERGVVDGIRRVQWGPHLDALCFHTQLQLEGWLVANGPPRDSPQWSAWAEEHAEMIATQRAAWEREHPVHGPDGAVIAHERPTWEDGEPEPWLRYVLVQNQIYNIPPGTLKSTIVMVCACAWIWLHEPTFAFGAASGIESNVKRDAKATRDLVRSAWYRETFSIGWEMRSLPAPPPELLALAAAGEDGADTVLADWYQQQGLHLMPDDAAREARRLADDELGIRRDADSVSDWATTVGGKRRSRTVNTGFTGTHVDGAFIDDPDDADRVWNESDRLRPQNRFTRAIENRVNCEHRSIRLEMQQVVHHEGFSAYLLSQARWSPRTPKGWAWLCIPARFGRGPADAPAETPYGWRDWRTQPDEMIHPRITAGVIADKLNKLGEAGVAAQYDQDARRVTAGILKRQHARFFVLEHDRERLMMLRRRPEGCPLREQQPPVIVRPGDLRKRTLSVDANNTLDLKPGTKPSAVGLLVNAMVGSDTLVLDDRTRILDISGTYLAIFEAMAAWQLDEILIELKAAGPGVVNELRIAIRRGWYMHPATDKRIEIVGPGGRPARPEVVVTSPREGKPARNQGLVKPWEDGSIFLYDGAPWLYASADASRKTVDAGFVGEVCSWSKDGDRSDRLDALSQYVARNRATGQASRTGGAPIVLTVAS